MRNERVLKASEMREEGSLHGKMIDRNWVLKRKRKRISSGLVPSNGKEGTSLPADSPRTLSVKRKLKGDISIPRFSNKIKGHDGYYFECVECDLGGNLLCCDSCPRTYHLECLSPPLKRTPPGKWQCPSCCEQKDYMKSLNNVEGILRRARSKSTSEKSKNLHTLSVRDKGGSVSGRIFFQEKNKLNNEGKPIFPLSDPYAEKKSYFTHVDISYRTKSNHSCDSGTRANILTPADNDEKKSGSPCCHETSSHNEVQPLVKNLSSDTSDKSPEEKSDLRKSGMQEKKLTLSLVRSTQKSKKKSQKVKRADKKKRSRSEKGKHTIDTDCQLKEISPIPQPKGFLHKRKSFDQQKSVSIPKEDSRILKFSGQKLPELSPEGTSEQGVKVDKTMKYHENLLDGVQQVDRIFGCRVQSCSLISSSHTQMTRSATSPCAKSGSDSCRLASGLPSSNFIVTKNRELLEDCYDSGKVEEKKNVEGFLTANWAGERKDAEDTNAVDETYSDKTCETKECMNKTEVLISATKSLKDRHVINENSEILDASAINAVDIEQVTLKKVTEKNADVKLACASNHANCEVRGHSHVPVTCVSEGINADDAENVIPKEVVRDSGPTVWDAVAYEFLVKWVGKSNIHNSWISESELKVLAKRKLENYKVKYGTTVLNICEEQWSKPHRVIALRVLKDGRKETLIKWCGLPYDECTWERLDEPVIEKSAHLISEFKQFECQALDRGTRDDFPKNKGNCQEVVTLTEQPNELQGGSLFPHQLEALNWLRKCWHKSKNVILADEMGLGKTVSACAFISSLYFEYKVKLPCLVLVPLSTMPNWMAEFALWAPHLNVVEYHGCAKARSIIRQYEWHASDTDGLHKITTYKFNVLLTTYEMVIADSSHLRSVPWEVLVVDEGHRLKNSGSKLFSLLNTFSFQHRVLLTGTPLQNNIGEMYNLLNFLQPISFPSLVAFEEKFNDLTTAEKVEELKKLVAPHMLRRLKKDAMQNIPPKTERTVPVELTSIQAEYYRAMLTKNYQILRNIGKGGAMQSMLNIVMQLRKVCNHPYLIPGTEPESGSVEFLQEMRIKASAKLTLLHSMLKILHKDGHRVLIFSQMTKLLDILEDYLTIEFGPKTFERVDGSVSVADRQAAIIRFNQDKSRFVFLLSTRSCGLGINLATADTVIIYDSDFNPHADIQAMNRAHRIGQSNRLLVYRLVVRASVEERILQLAKKKLMLDQLFVNKSESQKEVEDILRWGTEELFNDCDGFGGKDLKETSSSKVDALADGEQKHRRRSGGLGDVYKDRCTDGCTTIIWDESAILKLLDRSNIQSTITENTEGDLENDMLGSVKALDWNEELNEEPGGTELLPSITGDECEQPSEAKEENATSGIEENEWDRFLRVRWERHQIEEEAVLGRGKRLRKAVSYKETFAPIPSDALSEPSGNEEEEPEPQYTPAGRALKEKFAKLRARQKERLAQRHTTEATSTEIPQMLTQSPIPSVKEGEILDASKLVQDTIEEGSSINLEDNKLNQQSEAKNRKDSSTRVERFSKHGYKRFHSTHLDLSVSPPGIFSPDILLPSRQFQSTTLANSMHSGNLLPVLGLCAPNANQVNPSSRNFQSPLTAPMPNHKQRTTAGTAEFSFPPTSSAGSPNDVNLKGQETTDASLLPDTAGVSLHNRLKNFIPDNYFPFCLPPLTASGMGPSDALAGSGTSFSTFKEKLALPDFVHEEKPPSKFSFPSINALKTHTGLLPSLSLGPNIDYANGSPQNLSNVPLVPNFGQHSCETLKQKQEMAELPPMLNLGQMQAIHSPLPESHKKVLDNIMMRTQVSTNKFMKKRLKVDAWSEDELDALWIGVRRHGRGNWDAMLRDSKLKFSKHRTSEDLSTRWTEEQHKILDGPAFASPMSTSATFLGISDGMMTRALLGSKFSCLAAETPKFRSHLTDIQLGRGNLTSTLPSIEPPSCFSAATESCLPLPVWKPDRFRSDYPGEISTGPFERLEKVKIPLDQNLQHNSLSGCSFGSLSMNSSNSCILRQTEGESCGNKNNMFSSISDKSINLLHISHDNIHPAESNMGMPLDPPKKQFCTNSSTIDGNAIGSSETNKLPHWLRKAVSVPPSRPPEPELPPTVSAIAHSVRRLYGEDKPPIPPFTIPGPPPCQPKDPRKNLKKKRKLHMLGQVNPMNANSVKNLNHTTSSTVPPASQLVEGAPSLSRIDPNITLPPSNLNLNSTSSSSSFVPQGQKSVTTLSPSPEVLQLVASCVAPTSPATDMTSSSYQNTELHASKDSETYDVERKGVIGDLKGIRGKRKASRKSLLGGWGKLRSEQTVRLESEDSSNTRSDTCRADQLEVEEISSEKFVSNDCRNDAEP